MNHSLCPCGSSLPYANCCQVLHLGKLAPNALSLMRSRYTAYVLHNIDYLVKTTLPQQQSLLDVDAMQSWSQSVQWLGLDIIHHQEKIGKHHAQVQFIAHFSQEGNIQQHQELSTFVQIEQTWFFLDPTVALPSLKSACICGSEKKFKHCCGAFLRG